MNRGRLRSSSDETIDWWSVSWNGQGDLRYHKNFLKLAVCLFQELEASEELDTVCPKAPKLEER